jgi:predicted ribosome quality control (RQC) complex YloA/Tae2 family protein
VIDEGLDQEAFDLRKAALERELREKLKHANEQIRSNSASVAEAQSEPAWGRFGDLMKASLPNAAEIVEGTRDVQDYETGTTVKIPADPKLSAREQVEKFFRLERRKQKRLEEAQGRLGLFTESKDRLSAQLERTRAAKQWEELGPSHAHAAQPRSKASRSGSGWQGRDFHSKDGLSIWVGRNKIENLELTFKHAKGNDLWLHVRGRPGAHVVIPLSPGKSAPLETLLDAAALAVYYSGGEDWGKTEVDYTYKKHVKRIKDSSEASYTHNKTLILEPDKERLKRLLNGETA